MTNSKRKTEWAIPGVLKAVNMNITIFWDDALESD
jgi:hypothetical protein